MFPYCQKCYKGHQFDSLGNLLYVSKTIGYLANSLDYYFQVGNVEGHPGDSLGYYLSAQKYYKVPR